MIDIISATLHLLATVILVIWLINIERRQRALEEKIEAYRKAALSFEGVLSSFVRSTQRAITQVQDRNDALSARLSKLDGLKITDRRDPAHVEQTRDWTPFTESDSQAQEDQL